MIGFTAEYTGGDIIIDKHEIEKAAWFNKDMLPPLPIKISIARHLVDMHLNKKMNSSIFSKKMQYLFPIALILYELPLYFATNMILPALPQISQVLGTKANIAQLTIAIWFLGASCFQIILGPLADHLGRRRILLAGGMCFIAATLLSTMTNRIGVFLLARFIEGCVVSGRLRDDSRVNGQ